jgi:hypothetical protein
MANILFPATSRKAGPTPVIPSPIFHDNKGGGESTEVRLSCFCRRGVLTIDAERRIARSATRRTVVKKCCYATVAIAVLMILYLLIKLIELPKYRLSHILP